jgi:MoaA/NifB/PqqE/SkfB family radical SAM enzyme
VTTYGEFVQRTKLAARRRRIPTHVTLGLTHRCNLDCVHCYLRDERETVELSTQRWLGVLDEIVAAGGLWVGLTGGEPLLRPDFATIYARAKQLGLLVTVMTNGTLVNRRILELFARLPPHRVDVSLYARSPETYQAITGCNSCEAVYAVLSRRSHPPPSQRSVPVDLVGWA